MKHRWLAGVVVEVEPEHHEVRSLMNLEPVVHIVGFTVKGEVCEGELLDEPRCANCHQSPSELEDLADLYDNCPGCPAGGHSDPRMN